MRRAQLERLAEALEAWRQSLGRSFGPLTRSQRRFLHVVVGAPGEHIGTLAERLALSFAAATKMVDRLETLGCLERFREAATDQRFVRVQATALGRRFLEQANAAFLTSLDASLEPLTDDEQEALLHLLERCARGFDRRA